MLYSVGSLLQSSTIFVNIKSFGLIAIDPVSELRYSKIHPITPIDYIDNVWNREREGMKKLKVEYVFNKIMEGLN